MDKNKILKIKIINTLEELQLIKSDWDKLVEISSATIYQRSCWLFTWWKYYHNPKIDQMLVLLFYNKDNLVGIAPLYIHKDTFLGKVFFKSIHFIGSETLFSKTFGLFNDNSPSDYSDVICSPGFERIVIETLINFLMENKDLYDEIIFTNLNTQSIAYKYLPELLKDKDLKFILKEGEMCPYIQTPRSFEEYLNSRVPSVKRRLTQSWKESGKLFKIQKSRSYEELKNFLNEIKDLHQTKWNRIGFPGFFGDHRYEKFFNEFIDLCYNDGTIWCAKAHSNNRTIAGRLAFKYKGKFYDYLSGIDDTAPEAKRRPGLVLLMEMINDAITENIPVIDLLRGDESYKKDFTNLYNTNWNMRIYKSNINLRSIFIINLLVLKFLQILILREITLFKIWKKIYPLPNSIYEYTLSRIKSLIKKLKYIFKYKTL